VSADVRKAVDYLSGLPGVRRIWLFGSAAKGRALDARSDLDFSIEGLASTALCGTWSELDQRLDHEVDLVRWEEASEALRHQIRTHGILLYER